MTADIRVLVADDHKLVRAGMISLLNNLSGVEVVGEADNGRVAIDLVEELHPDVVLMDIAMSSMNGLEAAERIIGVHPECRVLILSMHSTEEYVVEALRIGVTGYLIKDAAASELEVAIRAVAHGERYLSPAVSTFLMDRYRVLTLWKEDTLQVLTPRQREILQLIAEGRSTKEIAGILKVATKTVETHRTQLMERLNIHDVAGLVRYAIRVGLISADK